MPFEYSNIELEKLLVNMMCLSTNNLEEAIKNINVDDFTNDICKQAYLWGLRRILRSEGVAFKRYIPQNNMAV